MRRYRQQPKFRLETLFNRYTYKYWIIGAAAVLLAGYEKDKAAAAALLGDFRAVAAAGLRGCGGAPLTGDAARRALSLADAAIQRLGAQVNPKIVLSVLAAKLG